MDNDKNPIYPDLNNVWAASSNSYSLNIIAHNMGIVAASMIEIGRASCRERV